ncbi:hypothetical protein MPTK1_4g11170 [Marchantia polymorpha subsp. ruderalis]|uniref:Uncharacterized protein n=2 Tax=Marchantia polymorpha TaxID=3197 RepID=A0AAF6B8Q3_MARPO|nr:hypothetical protein MARPO_0011s0102 [Marchantia polymorpha]BBN08387.1 hypothetical protein Mp_4g11170 [Marchantia polymorpha subsp. ruderalis]|eukprot:PTQ46423.1 hypothetical protein MARPO_0011s0102 [Marchantia polymorpha]
MISSKHEAEASKLHFLGCISSYVPNRLAAHVRPISRDIASRLLVHAVLFFIGFSVSICNTSITSRNSFFSFCSWIRTYRCDK